MSEAIQQSTSVLNLYERQKKLLPSIPSGVGIVGVGGVGSWLALYLALAGVPELWLWDGDTVSDHNLNRLPLTPQCIGKSKSEALEAEIKRFRPECNISAFANFTPEIFKAMDRKPLIWMVAATDSLKSRRMIYEACRDHAYLEIAAEGEYGTVTDAPADFATPDEENPGYQSVPVWVGPCVMAASIACAHILHGCSPNEKTYRQGWNPTKRAVEMMCHNPSQPPNQSITKTAPIKPYLSAAYEYFVENGAIQRKRRY